MADRRAGYLRRCTELDARALEVKGMQSCMTVGEQGERLMARRMFGGWGVDFKMGWPWEWVEIGGGSGARVCDYAGAGRG